jgi:spoIIIJ-associated protein
MADRSIQVSGPDVDKAVARGLAQLGLSRDQVRIEVLDQGSRGILGIGARDALVRLEPSTPVTVQTEPPSRQPDHTMAEPEPIEPTPDLLDYESVDIEELETTPEDAEYELSTAETAEIARQALVELLEKMGMDCQVVIRQQELQDEPIPITLDVLGQDLKALIGHQGEVLNALQYITRLIVSREVEHWVNLIVDVEKYKQRRAKSLQQLAERIAERVAHTRQPIALEPMPPNERRVIHIALHNHPAVTTQSVGKGDDRKVTIIPRR